jgi:tetratricopeptide (TPR) repeat protein
MVSVSRIKIKCADLLGVRSSSEAFLASKISDSWIEIEDLFKIVSAIMTRTEFNKTIDSFFSRGAIESDNSVSNKIEVNEGRDFRDYGTIKFDNSELSEAPQLPENLKKEILFLYYYGKNINYYKILNIPESYNAPQEKIAKRCNCYRQLFAGKNFEGIDLGNYFQKLAKARETIRTASQIEDSDIRKKYDAFLMTTSHVKNTSSDKKKEEKIKTSTDRANERFLVAMKLLHEKDVQQAYNEILIALHLDPDNKEYLDFKNEISEKLKEEKTNSLFNALERNDMLLLDESKLEQVIDNILELTDDSPLTHLKLAEIAIEKGMPEMAVQHAAEAIRKDPDLKIKVAEIVKKAQQKKREFNPDQEKDIKTYQINRNNIARKN